MTRAPSALLAIGGFGVAVAASSVIVTSAIVLFAPEPPALRVTPRAAVAALKGEDARFDRRVGPPPEGARALYIEQLLAIELRRPPSTVRAVWVDGTRVLAPQPGVSIAPPGRADRSRSPSTVLIERQGERWAVIDPFDTSDTARAYLLDRSQPAFVASVQSTNGRWLTVTPRQAWLSGWRLQVLAALAASLAILAPLAWLFARRLTRPFRALACALADPAAVVPTGGPRELREAATAIIRMRASLAEQAAERARMLSAVAHDLRTPLTGLRLRIEAAPEPARARMVTDVERMHAMIREVLDFARAAHAPRQRLAVRLLLADVMTFMPDGYGQLQLLPGPEAWVEVVPDALRRAVENLFRNALDYAGSARVEVRSDGEQVVISVIDGGPGIPAAERERLMRPFERGEASRNRDTGGAGLGLSIISDFASGHGGQFVLADAPGGGVIAALKLPAV